MTARILKNQVVVKESEVFCRGSSPLRTFRGLAYPRKKTTILSENAVTDLDKNKGLCYIYGMVYQGIQMKGKNGFQDKKKW